MTYIIPDLDIDISQKSREDMLEKLHHIPASKINEKGIFPHGVGIYMCDIPQDRISGLASIDYKHAEEDLGYIKIDFLHNTVYDDFISRNEIIDSLNKEPNWGLLYKKEIIEQLPHINNYYTLLNQLPLIDSVEKLAMFIAIIRPGKKYLIDDVLKNGWKSIIDKIWLKENNGYQYKKSHAIAYALSIIVAMSKFN